MRFYYKKLNIGDINMKWFEGIELYVDSYLIEVDYYSDTQERILEMFTAYRTTERPGFIITLEAIE